MREGPVPDEHVRLRTAGRGHRVAGVRPDGRSVSVDVVVPGAAAATARVVAAVFGHSCVRRASANTTHKPPTQTQHCRGGGI